MGTGRLNHAAAGRRQWPLGIRYGARTRRPDPSFQSCLEPIRLWHARDSASVARVHVSTYHGTRVSSSAGRTPSGAVGRHPQSSPSRLAGRSLSLHHRGGCTAKTRERVGDRALVSRSEIERFAYGRVLATLVTVGTSVTRECHPSSSKERAGAPTKLHNLTLRRFRSEEEISMRQKLQLKPVVIFRVHPLLSDLELQPAYGYYLLSGIQR